MFIIVYYGILKQYMMVYLLVNYEILWGLWEYMGVYIGMMENTMETTI